MLAVSTEEDDLVLDFFAGSGTTGHAVVDMNRQDGGNRKFILVQLPEPTGREGLSHHRRHHQGACPSRHQEAQ